MKLQLLLFLGNFHIYRHTTKFFVCRFLTQMKQTDNVVYTDGTCKIDSYALIRHEDTKGNKPPTLPRLDYRPKQSLGQNYLADQNYVNKICHEFFETDDGSRGENGCRVVEFGAGTGALTRILIKEYPDMTAIELDPRTIGVLSQNLPRLDIIHDDVLQVDYKAIAEKKGGPLFAVGNLPFFISSQVLFCLLDRFKYFREALFTVQWEMGQRIVSKPGDQDYSILGAVMSLYCKSEILFGIPNTVFYPIPKVRAALVRIKFHESVPSLNECNPKMLREILRATFQHRRQMIRKSLNGLFKKFRPKSLLPESWGNLRPDIMSIYDFITLTKLLYPVDSSGIPERLWRKRSHGD